MVNLDENMRWITLFKHFQNNIKTLLFTYSISFKKVLSLYVRIVLGYQTVYDAFIVNKIKIVFS